MRWLLIIILCSVLLLVGCTSTDLTEQPGANTTTASTTDTPTTACTAGMKCVDEKKIAYQDEDCDWSNLTTCEHGCADDACAPPPPAEVCTSGFKCKSDKKMGYQLESCDWIKTKTCEFGCENAECLPKPENYTDPAEVEPEEEESEPAEETWTLTLGDEIPHTLNDKEYNVSLALIESKGARIRINGLLSEWLQDGDNYYVQGFNLTVKEVLFQAYGGGIQEVSYSVSDS